MSQCGPSTWIGHGSPHNPDFAIGVDAGGTATRALAVAANGGVCGRGRAGAGNPNSYPAEQAAAAIVQAINDALTGLDPAAAKACVVGMAGRSRLTDPAVATVFDRAWAGLGLTPSVVSDAEAAFASVTPESDGTVLIAGTGSIAGRIRNRRMVATAGGYGWLLGDEGSGFWIGRQAVRATLDALGSGKLGVLTEAVLERMNIDPAAARPTQELITAVNSEPPIRLARLAPLVSLAHDDGDPAAVAIVDQAARQLVDTALTTRDPGETTPLVLAGSVLGETSPVGAHVRAELPGLNVLASDDGVLGAAWLAALEAFGDNAPRLEPAGEQYQYAV